MSFLTENVKRILTTAAEGVQYKSSTVYGNQ